MRKGNGLLNSELLQVISGLGHFQTIMVTDAGTPVPPETPLIDLAVIPGLPGLAEVTRAIIAEMAVEKITFTEETKAANPDVLQTLMEISSGLETDWMTHEELKAQCRRAICVVRTGECTPYANVMLTAGVPF